MNGTEMDGTEVEVMGRCWGWLVAAVLGVGLAGAGTSQALTLDVEFDTGNAGNFASLVVTKVGNDLLFEIETNVAPNTDLGPDADLQEFYFNLVGAFTGLSISSTDPQHANGMYELLLNPPVLGGAGASFEFGVNFGNGNGPPGNGVLQSASFTLSADQELFPSSLLELSSTNNAGSVHFAAHFQTTAWAGAPGDDSETVGGVVPEPMGVPLLGLGLGGLLVMGRRRRRQGGPAIP